MKFSPDDQVANYSWRAFHCELCKAKYADHYPTAAGSVCLFEVSKPERDYMILESYM